jgi:hypothetical protein
VVECLQDLSGPFRLSLNPTAYRGMVRRLARGQEDWEQIRGLTQAQPKGNGNRGQLPLLDWVQDDRLPGKCLQFGDPPLELLDLDLLFGEPRPVPGRLGQPLFDLAGMLIDCLAAAL